MLKTTAGLVISERQAGETDRIIDILTAQYGIIQVSAKGANKLIGKNNSSTQLFAYSDFCFNERAGRYYLNSSQPKTIFYELRLDLKKLSLACYFSELVKYTVTSLQSANDIMRLMLNTLHFLCDDSKNPQLLKSIFELRLCSEIGMLPQLIGCRECYCYEAEEMYFLIDKAVLLCKNHFDQDESYYNVRISNGTVNAMRFICLTEIDRLFNFKVSDTTMKQLSEITEKYILCHLDRSFKSLDYYKSVL